MRCDNFDIHQLINDLSGTCKSFEEALPEDMNFEDLTDTELATLDGEIFRCAECDWWHEVSDLSDSDDNENYCIECRPQQDD